MAYWGPTGCCGKQTVMPSINHFTATTVQMHSMSKSPHLIEAIKVLFVYNRLLESICLKTWAKDHRAGTLSRMHSHPSQQPAFCLCTLFPSSRPALLLPESYIILSTSRLSTYRINNAPVKPITLPASPNQFLTLFLD